MRVLSFVFLLVSVFGFSTQAQQLHLDSTSTPNRPVYRVVQERPQFPGGMALLSSYLRKNLRYPEAASKANLEGRVFVTFIVSEHGDIQNVQILRTVNLLFDAEAIRLVKGMPKWTPARQDGKEVACRFNLPINFSLTGLP